MNSPDYEYQVTKDLTLDTMERYNRWIVEQLGKRKRVIDHRDIQFLPMPTHADSDYEVWIKHLFIGFHEVKCRRNPKGKYQKTKIPLRKHATAEHYWKAEQKKSFFLCRFSDEIVRFALWQEPDEVVTMVARHDRGADEDVYALYDVSRAITICKLESPYGQKDDNSTG